MLKKAWVVFLSNKAVWSLVGGILMLIAMGDLDNIWLRNSAHLLLIKNMPFSPYICYISSEDCGVGIDTKQDQSRFTWLFHLVDAGNVVYTPHGLGSDTLFLGKSEYIEIPVNRTELIWLAKGSMLFRDGLEEQAITAWRNAPMIAYYLINLSQILEDIEQSVDIIRLSLRILPTVDGYYQLGANLYELGRTEEAITAFEQALEWPELDIMREAKIYQQLGKLYSRLDNIAMERESYERVISLRSDVPPHIYINLAKAYLQLGELEQAHEILQVLLVRNEEVATGWWLLGEVERRRGNISNALEAYYHYYELEPGDERVIKRISEIEGKK